MGFKTRDHNLICEIRAGRPSANEPMAVSRRKVLPHGAVRAPGSRVGAACMGRRFTRRRRTPAARREQPRGRRARRSEGSLAVNLRSDGPACGGEPPLSTFATPDFADVPRLNLPTYGAQEPKASYRRAFFGVAMSIDLLRQIAATPLHISLAKTKDIDAVKLLRQAALVISLLDERPGCRGRAITEEGRNEPRLHCPGDGRPLRGPVLRYGRCRTEAPSSSKAPRHLVAALLGLWPCFSPPPTHRKA